MIKETVELVLNEVSPIIKEIMMEPCEEYPNFKKWEMFPDPLYVIFEWQRLIDRKIKDKVHEENSNV